MHPTMDPESGARRWKSRVRAYGAIRWRNFSLPSRAGRSSRSITRFRKSFDSPLPRHGRSYPPAVSVEFSPRAARRFAAALPETGVRSCCFALIVNPIRFPGIVLRNPSETVVTLLVPAAAAEFHSAARARHTTPSARADRFAQYVEAETSGEAPQPGLLDASMSLRTWVAELSVPGESQVTCVMEHLS
jgi:hypothetical protein